MRQRGQKKFTLIGHRQWHQQGDGPAGWLAGWLAGHSDYVSKIRPFRPAPGLATMHVSCPW